MISNWTCRERAGGCCDVVKQMSVCVFASKGRHNEGGRKDLWCEMRQMSVSGALCVWLVECMAIGLDVFCVCVLFRCITTSKSFCHSGVPTDRQSAIAGRRVDDRHLECFRCLEVAGSACWSRDKELSRCDVRFVAAVTPALSTCSDCSTCLRLVFSKMDFSSQSTQHFETAPWFQRELTPSVISDWSENPLWAVDG